MRYLNYGNLQIDYLAFLDKSSNEIYDYVESLPWSEKRKKEFISTYSDILKRGLKGASNESGVWKIIVGGDLIPEEQREKYENVADYMQQLMASLPTIANQEEEAKRKAEEEKAKLPIFDNEYFTTNFINHLSKKEFGGNKKIDWDNLDKRDEKTGIRGREERAKMLARNLQSYADSLDETKLNFEGSPFENLLDFKNRINEAVYALTKTPDNIDDDNETLRRLGIRASDWFNNGSGDPSGKYDETGRELSYAELAQYNLELEKEKLAALKQAIYDNKLFFNRVTSPKMLGRSSVELKEKYKDNNSLLTALLGYAQQDIRSLTPDEISEVHGAYRNLAKVPIDSKLLSQLQNSANGLYVGSSPNRFKKINGIDNLIWDSHLLQVIQINNRQLQQAVLTLPLDLFKGVKTKLEKEDEYWNSPIKELDSYDYANVIGALADVASIADVEPVSAAILAEIGTAARSYGRSKDTGFWENALYTTGDAAIGALSAIPVAGDAALGWRLGAAGLKYLGYAGLIFNAKNLPEAGKAFSKWYNYATQDGFSPVEAYKKLTRKEAQDLQNGLLELVGIKGAVSGATARKVTKPITSNKQKVVDVDVKVNGNQTKLTVTPEEAKQLRTGLAGKLEKSNNKLRSTKSALEYARKNNVKVEDIEIVSAPGRIPFTRNSGMNQRTIDVEGQAKPKDFGRVWRPFARWQSKFNSVNNNSSENFWTRNFGGYKPKSEQNSTLLSTQQPTLQSTQLPTLSSTNIPKSKTEIRRDWKNTIERGNFTNNEITPGDYKVGHFNIKVSKTNDGKYKIHTDAYSSDAHGPRPENPTMKPLLKNFENLKELLKEIAKIVNESRRRANLPDVNGKRAGINHKEIGKILQDLKAKGWLKEGGKIIDKLKIQKYKEFINK